MFPEWSHFRHGIHEFAQIAVQFSLKVTKIVTYGHVMTVIIHPLTG